MISGIEQAWEILAGLNPEDVGKRARVTFDASAGCYTLKTFGQDILISPKDRSIFGNAPLSHLLLDKLRLYSELSILSYLIKVRELPLSGRLVKPYDAGGGQIYFRGSHVLPLDGIAEKYGSDITGFLDRGRELGGEVLGYGDAALRLFPFPRIALALVLWKKDEEFPARCELLFDETTPVHLPADIIWATAAMTVQVVLES